MTLVHLILNEILETEGIGLIELYCELNVSMNVAVVLYSFMYFDERLLVGFDVNDEQSTIE